MHADESIVAITLLCALHHACAHAISHCKVIIDSVPHTDTRLPTYLKGYAELILDNVDVGQSMPVYLTMLVCSSVRYTSDNAGPFLEGVRESGSTIFSCNYPVHVRIR